MLRKLRPLLMGYVVGLAMLPTDSAMAADCVASLDAERTTGPKLIECIVEIHGELVALRDEIEPFRQAKGAVLAFDRSEDRGGGEAGGACPIGWALFRPAGGRVIVGAGQHPNDLRTYPAYSDNAERAVGGAETHSLTIEEMPRHKHKMGRVNLFIQNSTDLGARSTVDTRPDGVNIPWYMEGSAGIDERPIDIAMEAAGSSQAHNNMPPYIALYFCKKEG